MSTGGLTDQQITFINKYLPMPKRIGKKKVEDKRNQWATEFRSFNVRREWIRGEINKIENTKVANGLKLELHKAEEIIEANTKKPDFEGGLRHLAVVKRTVVKQCRQEKCAKAVERARTAFDVVMKTDPANKDRLLLVWGFTQDKYEHALKTTNIDDFTPVFASIEVLEEEILAATPKDKSTSSVQIESTQRELEKDALRREPRQRVNVAENSARELLAKIKASFDDPAPLAIKNQVDAMPALLDVDMDGEPDEINDAANAIEAAVTTLTNDSKSLFDGLSSWEKELSSFMERLGVLQQHPQASNELIEPLINGLKGRVQTASTKADSHDYPGAKGELAAATTDLDEAFKAADAVADFANVYADREERITALRQLHDSLKTSTEAGISAATSTGQANDSAVDAINLLAPAKLAKDNRDLNAMKAARPNLAQIPDKVTEATWLLKQAERYGRTYAGLVQASLTMDTWNAARVLAAEIAAFKAQLTAAKIDTTGDYRVSMSYLSKAWGFKNQLAQRRAEYNNYANALREFDARHNDIIAMRGELWHVAVCEYDNRLIRDRQHAVDRARAPKREYAMAIRLLEATKDGHNTEVEKGTLAKGYIDIKEWYDTEIPNLETNVGADQAREVIADLRAGIAKAEEKRTEGDWAIALELLERLRPTWQLAADLTQAGWIFENTNRTVAVDNMDADLDAAFQVYINCRQLVTDKNDTDFSKRLKAADKERDEARKAVKTAPPYDEAKRLLNSAILQCRELLVLAHRKERFEERLSNLRGEVSGLSNKEWNLEGILNSKLQELKDELDNAKREAGKDLFDFDSAEARLTRANAIIFEAAKMSRVFEDVKKLRGDMRTCLLHMQDPTRRDGCSDEIVKLQQLLSGIEVDVGNENMDDALKKAIEGKGLLQMYYITANDFADYSKLKVEKLDPALALLPTARVFSAEEENELADLQRSLRANLDKKLYGTAKGLLWSIVQLARRIIDLERDGERWKTLHDELDRQLQQLKSRVTTPHPAITEKLNAFDALFDTAKQQAAAEVKNYRGAIKRAETLAPDELKPLIDAYLTCLESRTTALDQIGQILRLPDQSAIEASVERLQGKQRQAGESFNGGDFLAAQSLYEELTIQCQSALETVAKVSAYAQLTDDVKKLSAEDDEGLETALRQAKTMVQELRAAPEIFYIFSDVTSAQESLGQAEELVTQDVDQAKTKLVAVMDACARARVELEHYAQLTYVYNFAEKQIQQFLDTHSQASLVRDDLQGELDAIAEAMNSVRTDHGKRGATATRIEQAVTKLDELRKSADAHVEAVYLIDTITDLIGQLERHKNRQVIQPEINQARTDLDDGRTKANERKHDLAMPVLTKTHEAMQMALLKANMESGEPPNVNEIKAILAQKDGEKKLDALVKTLDAKSQRKVLNLLLEARFGCKLTIYKDSKYGQQEMEDFKNRRIPLTPKEIKQREKEIKEFKKRDPEPEPHEIERMEDKLEDDRTNGRLPTSEEIDRKQQEVDILNRSRNFDPELDRKAPDIRRFYEVMSKLPPSDTIDNDSFQIFNLKSGEASGSAYSGGRKAIIMSEGDMEAGSYYGVGLEYELDTIDANCKPKPGEALTYFNWNTLHEVGHAVDDKLGYMKRRGEALAGWKMFGKDVLPVATVIARHFKYDADYIAAYMSGISNPPKPVMDASCPNEDEWEARRLDARAHVDRIRSTNKPWQTAATAKACEIGTGAEKLCYQESYPGTWSAYPLAARKQGVTGYQFRAPGEWFSELYAAYYSNKMNDSHPARAWLDTLQPPTA